MLNLEKIMFLKVLSYLERVFSMQLFSIAYGQPHVEANSSAIFAEKRKTMFRKKTWNLVFNLFKYIFNEPNSLALQTIIFQMGQNGILLPKLFWPTVRKNCSSDREITRTIYSNSERSE